MNMILDNMAWGVTGHDFDCIDEETRNAITYDLGSDFLSEADIESLVKTLYFKAYHEDDELRVRYTIPDFVFKIYRLAKSDETLRKQIESHRRVSIGNLKVPTLTRPKGQSFKDLNSKLRHEIVSTLQEILFVSYDIARELAETLFYKYDANKEEISFGISLFLVALSAKYM